eukprot:TRINITY_DN22348_c0_g1_i1.p1 TRINITY_DN22348_c0_g1~~TRINITY_DN22348_c0_g1_i1.p1  ORF type:complete len:369 (-),score=69.53 TRINITY_DN22348_c0_g1_i1:58-1164(-)
MGNQPIRGKLLRRTGTQRQIRNNDLSAAFRVCLPDHVWGIIVSYVRDPWSLAQICATCRKFHHLLRGQFRPQLSYTAEQQTSISVIPDMGLTLGWNLVDGQFRKEGLNPKQIMCDGFVTAHFDPNMNQLYVVGKMLNIYTLGSDQVETWPPIRWRGTMKDDAKAEVVPNGKYVVLNSNVPSYSLLVKLSTKQHRTLDARMNPCFASCFDGEGTDLNWEAFRMATESLNYPPCVQLDDGRMAIFHASPALQVYLFDPANPSQRFRLKKCFGTFPNIHLRKSKDEMPKTKILREGRYIVLFPDVTSSNRMHILDTETWIWSAYDTSKMSLRAEFATFHRQSINIPRKKGGWVTISFHPNGTQIKMITSRR